ncbi:MAG: hypothetical protein ABIH03_11190 [Pseudomonadota bacterium]
MARRKYGNVQTEYNGRVYTSKLEADTAQRLDLLLCAADDAERVAEWTAEPARCRYRYGVLDKWPHYTFDFRVRWVKATAHHAEEELWECKGAWSQRDRQRLNFCRDWHVRNGTPLVVRVVYKDREEVLR